MTLLDLVNVLDENEVINVKYSKLYANTKQLKESNSMVNVLDLDVKRIETDGNDMLFVTVG